jgi:hypothetical protein
MESYQGGVLRKRYHGIVNSDLARSVVVGGGVMLGLGLVGCVSNYGSLRKDAAITAKLEQGVEQPNLEFYVLGGTTPSAVVGIKPGYDFDPGRYWKKVEQKALPELISDINRSAHSASGGSMLGEKGQEIGIYYSGGGLTIEMEGNKVKVSISPSSSGVGGGASGGSGGAGAGSGGSE